MIFVLPDQLRKAEIERQKQVDRYYRKHGPCCAGCDWWRHYSALAGECTKSAPVSAAERDAMIGLENASIRDDGGAGHVITPRDHLCGGFIDSYSWSFLHKN